MSTIKMFFNCMFSPRLIRIYERDVQERAYEPSTIEKWGDTVINSLYVIWRFGVYTSPLLVCILYQRGYLESSSLGTLSKLATSVGVILIVSFFCRGLCRSQNPTYVKFVTTLNDATKNVTEAKRELKKYDFDFAAWPVEYELNNYGGSKVTIESSISKSLFGNVLLIPYKVIAYLAIHTFGIRIIYPGSFGFLQIILEPSLVQGRNRMVELFRGERFKLQTVDKNHIDSIFIDKRNVTDNGNILVICCEGNAGFYEIGIATTPIDAGYSVLGWNHPGFGGSTGKPYPPQEQNAMDAVVQFAINVLEFKLDNIVFFGWSIGGYTSSWAAMNYPDCRGLILDATFDDILPLAINYMPSWWESIVKLAVREHVNLHVSQQIFKYPGPILLIRRTEDEVICLKDGILSSNRGNHLLIKLLKYRYPFLIGDNQVNLLNEYLSVTGHFQDEIIRKNQVDENECYSLMQSYVLEYSKSYPMKIGEEYSNQDQNKLALYLAQKYLKDFKATHCVNLPTEMFELPWDIPDEADFVLT